MLLDPDTLDLAPCAAEVLQGLAGDGRFKLEMPASHLEIALGPFAGAEEIAPALRQARVDLAAQSAGRVMPATAGVHPFSASVGILNDGERYDDMRSEYAGIARRQLVCALQVQVAVGGAERTLAVYNALRSYLPVLAALSANAPFYEGGDCGLASVRPKLCELLPRQGVPPAIESWAHLARIFDWGRRAQAFAQPRTWWWELRPHVGYGTLELRVPDAQITVQDAAAVTAVAYALVTWLAERHAGGESLAVAETWQIEENRWSACRHGVHGAMADLITGVRAPTGDLLHALLDDLAPVAARLGGAAGLARARELALRNGADAQRAVAREHGVRQMTRWLAERFLA
jgi:carboxylate-amine ligase